MDDADRAQSEIDLAMNMALQVRAEELPNIGICHYCSDQIETGHFCDEDCRDDYQTRKNNQLA